jgi:hypothetical protein
VAKVGTSQPPDWLPPDVNVPRDSEVCMPWVWLPNVSLTVASWFFLTVWVPAAGIRLAQGCMRS